MSTPTVQQVTFTPRLAADDPLANYWLRQVSVRLRREIAWLWYERGEGMVAPGEGLLPPFSDITQETLDLSRFAAAKQRFFEEDPTAEYLSNQLPDDPPEPSDPVQGSFSWVVGRLGLDSGETFLLALCAAAAFDHTLGSVIAACHNHPNKIQPTLALAQKLWDEPHALIAAADAANPLFHLGLLRGPQSGSGYADRAHQEEIAWETPLSMPPLVANQLLFVDAALPPALAVILPIQPKREGMDSVLQMVANRAGSAPGDELRIVPVRGRRGSARREVVAQIAALSGRPVVEFSAIYSLLGNARYLDEVATLCWLRGEDLFIEEDLLAALSAELDGSRGSRGPYPARALPSSALPILLYLGISDRAQLSALPAHHWLPVVDVPEFTYADRLAFWRLGMGAWAKSLDGELAEISRRFRFGKETLIGILTGLLANPTPPDGAALMAACRAEVDLELGELAQKVTPRFTDEKLFLPPLEAGQFAEVAQAMRALTEVHYSWGTARAWNESGITALFAGPSGAGKTMAAELLAIQLALPIYRIDLSQVVNKYIGETEKNLKRLFDAADDSDMILFFDEADALFGKRTEVKDAHDRYANIEINYLLERMERFKGMAILATNRKKDLDEAFLRRLRYIVDFPLPGMQQRLQIWRQVIPKGVDTKKLDFEFLAEQFRLSGGSIRSVVFNACLQSAGIPGKKRRLEMETVLIAIKREYDKLNSSVSLENFGPYAEVIRPYERQEDPA